jgi:PAS domain S-box-containing protein
MSIKPRVLYVDDEKDNLVGFKYMFREYYEISTVTSAKEALDLMADADAFDVVIADQRMPNMTGVELFSLLVKDYPDTMRMILTGYSDIDAVIDAVNKGQIYYYFKKPWDETEVRVVIDHALESLGLQRELSMREQRFHQIAESMGDWIWEMDVATCYTYASERVKDVLGYSPDEMIGKTPFELMPSSEAKRVGGIFAGIMSRKQPIKEVEHWSLAKNGDRVCLQTSGVAILDGAGNLLGYRGVDRDITERKRAEDDLVRLSTAINQAEEGVLITNKEGSIEYVNPAFESITGYSRAEVVGQNPRLLKSGLHDDRFYEEIWRKISTGHSWKGRFQNKCKNGSFYTEDCIISPVHDSGGNIVNYVAVMRDVTKELRLEEEYRQAQKMDAVGRLASGVAHDFNNILQAILGFSGILMMATKTQESLHNDVIEIQSAAERASELTRQLLALSRKRPTNLSSVYLNEVVVNEQKMLERLLRDNHRLVFVPEDDLKPIKGDAGQLEQVVMNLVVNARDAMPDGGEITIRTENVPQEEMAYAGKDGAFVRLLVSDCGDGMDQEVLGHLFEPFFTTKTGSRKGTGLGLSVVYGIVKTHEGWIDVESALGQGTTFSIYLPVSSRVDEMSKESTPPPDVSDLNSGRGERILLVEDDPVIRDLNVRILQDAGYRIECASDSSQALKSLDGRKDGVDLLFSDVVLPGQSGLELAEEVRRRYADLPILLCSGCLHGSNVHNAIKQNGFGFVEKPVGMTALLQTVREMLDESRKV